MESEPFTWAVAAVILLLPVAFFRPKLAVYGYLALLFYFPNVGWGVAEPASVFNLYGRGTGVLPIPIVNVGLYGLTVLAFLVWPRPPAYPSVRALQSAFWAFNAFFVAYVIAGLSQSVSLADAISSYGLVNVLNMSLVSLVVIRAFRTKQDVTELVLFIILCALTRDLWGLFRFAFLGGDLANVYANIQGQNVTLTFFDINDSLVATLAVFLAAWLLLFRSREVGPFRRVLYLLTVVAGLTVILLSYRRTSWAGLVLAGSVFVLLQPWRRRLQLAAVVGFLGVLIVFVLAVQRFEGLGSARSGTGLLLYDVVNRGGVSWTRGRFGELYRAFETIQDHPILGIGPWGGIGPGGTHDFVHSGLMHVWLKGGTLGLLLFLAILGAFGFLTVRWRRLVQPADRGLFEASVAGVAFLLPTLLFGTPIIEFRTMALLGLLLALPFVVTAAYASPRTAGAGGRALTRPAGLSMSGTR